MVAYFPHGEVQVAGSFAEFLARYVSGDLTVLLPQTVMVADGDGVGNEFNGVVTYAVRWAGVRTIGVAVVVLEAGSAEALWTIDYSPAVRPFVAPVDLVA